MQVANEFEIDGVAYLSKKIKDVFAYPQGVNLAILIPYNVDSTSLYWNRSSEVLLTNPVRYSDFLVMNSKYSISRSAYFNLEFLD